MRSALWLTEAESFSITKTSQLLGETHKATEELVRSARAGFRGYYVDAVKRNSLADGCSDTLDKLAAYVGRTLPAGDVANVEHHLADCKDCRSIVMKLDDLESRLHAAIPSLPAWTRQQVADTWTTYVPLTAAKEVSGKDEKEAKKGGGGWIGLIAVAAAALIVFVGSGVFNADSDEKVANQSTTTAGPTTVPNAVATPGVGSPTTSLTPQETTTSAVEAPTSDAPRRSTPTTQPRRSTTTRPRTSTTAPNTGYTLVDLPPTPMP